MYKVFEELLRQKGVTVADVCRATGIRQSTMSNWKKRGNQLSAKNAQLVADYFGVSIDYLMGNKAVNMRPETVERSVLNQEEYFLNQDARELAQFLFENPEYKVLFDASRKVKKEDIQFVKDLMDRMS